MANEPNIGTLVGDALRSQNCYPLSMLIRLINKCKHRSLNSWPKLTTNYKILLSNSKRECNIKMSPDLLIKRASLVDTVLSLDNDGWALTMVGALVANTLQEHPGKEKNSIMCGMSVEITL